MRFLFLLIIFLIQLLNEPSNAGVWISSGGENLTDKNNPWFLSNTKKISYCLSVDENGFSLDPKTLEIVVEKAISDWNDIFYRYQKQHSTNKLVLGTQSWIKMNCLPSTNVDVRFKFGWNALNLTEKKFLSIYKNEESKIAEIVRTQYDFKNLKGKGLIFFSSDKGEKSLKLDNSQIKNPWKYQSLVYLILMHELGHLYGLSHVSSSIIPLNSRWIMSEYFPEMILKHNFWNYSEALNDIEKVRIKNFFDSTTYENCETDSIKKIYNQSNTQAKCLEINFVGEKDFPDKIIFNLKNEYKQIILSTKLDNLSWRDVITKGDIFLYLTNEQEVYESELQKQSGIPIIMGPGETNGEYSGNLNWPLGTSLKVTIVKQDSVLKLIGIDKKDNTIKTLFKLHPVSSN